MKIHSGNRKTTIAEGERDIKLLVDLFTTVFRIVKKIGKV